MASQPSTAEPAGLGSLSLSAWLSTAPFLPAASASSDASVAASVACVRQTLEASLEQSGLSAHDWLQAALKRSESVFACNGRFLLPDSEQKVSEADKASSAPSSAASSATAPHDEKEGSAEPAQQQQQQSGGELRLAFELPASAASQRQAEIAHPLLPVVSCYRMSLPFPSGTSDADVEAVMSRVLSLCQPARFGVGDESVLDPSYRACSQLAVDRFFTSFNPLDTSPSIVRAVLQQLCPRSLPLVPELRAELYKLNVYSAGGLFRSHRDTPRSPDMLGSLVVCLPVPHAGGALLVRQGDRTVRYDWGWDLQADAASGGEARRSVQWAAFFGDCEHEVLPVTAGHRVTLTYNLHAATPAPPATPVEPAQPAADLAGAPATAAAAALDCNRLSIPFPALLSLLLKDGSFMPQGGRLGVYCQHGYAHSSNAMQGKLKPALLKGIDALLFDAVRKLQLPVQFRPIIQAQWCEGLGEGDGEEEQRARDYCHVLPDFSAAFENCEDAEEGSDVILGAPVSTDVRWLNSASGWELQEALPSYGNEPGMGAFYSAAALLITVPPWIASANERGPPVLVQQPAPAAHHSHYSDDDFDGEEEQQEVYEDEEEGDEEDYEEEEEEQEEEEGVEGGSLRSPASALLLHPLQQRPQSAAQGGEAGTQQQRDGVRARSPVESALGSRRGGQSHFASASHTD